MFLLSINNVVPDFSLTQEELWEEIKDSKQVAALQPKSQMFLQKVLLGENGIKKRHFACQNLAQIMAADAQLLNQLFEKEAPKLGAKALGSLLEQSNLGSADIDALFVCTCTGYLCPGLSSHIAEHLNMPESVHMVDLVGLGCGAAIPTLRCAKDFLTANPGTKAAVVAVEVCSTAFYLDDDPGVLVSFCLFGDGASASIWSNERGSFSDVSVFCNGFDSLHIPQERQKLRFENVRGKLRNRLDRTVPKLAAEAVEILYRRRQLEENPRKIIVHPGGKRVLEAVEASLKSDYLNESYQILGLYGNMSSPSVLFCLEQALNHGQDLEDIWLSSFGAGFTCYSCNMQLI